MNSKNLMCALVSGLLLLGPAAHAIELKRPDLSQRVSRGDFKLPIVLLGTDIEVYELTASGQTNLKKDETELVQQRANEAITAYFSNKNDMKLVKVEALSEQQQAEVKEYFALYDAIAGSAMMAFVPGWEDRKNNFDYTLGHGLPWLKDKIGGRYALVAMGRDYVSSGGRVAMMLLLAAGGIGIPMGASFSSVGMVDLENGDLTWLSRDMGMGDLKNPDTAKWMFTGMMDRMLIEKAN